MASAYSTHYGSVWQSSVAVVADPDLQSDSDLRSDTDRFCRVLTRTIRTEAGSDASLVLTILNDKNVLSNFQGFSGRD